MQNKKLENINVRHCEEFRDETIYTPQIRFAGFTDEWQKKKLGECCDYVDYRGKTPNKTKEGIFLITAKNIKKGYIDYEVSKEYVSESDYAEVMHRGLPKSGDVLITTEAPCGNIAQIKIENVALAQRIIKYRGHKDTINNDYLIFFCLSPYFQNLLESLSSGGTVKGIKGSLLHQQIISFPTLPEQQKLGELFSTLDNIIATSEQKVQKMQNVKKTLLQKMFVDCNTPNSRHCEEHSDEAIYTPQIRFAGFIGEWQKKKLGEVAEIFDGVHQTPKYTNNGIMFLSVENIETLTSEKYISEKDFNRDYKIYPTKGDILMTRIGDIGTPNVYENYEKIAYYVSLALIKTKVLDSYFLKNSIQSPLVKKGLRDRSLLTAIPQKINKNEINNVYIQFPTHPEQQKIGELFSKLDALISLHQQKVQKVKNIKSALLKKCFV